MNRILYLFPILFLIVSIVFSCGKEDDLITDGSAQLEFSTDTLTFDTVFTTIGSATRIIKAYNPHNKSIKISRVALVEGNNSKFRINIDGIATNEAKDIVVAPRDSMYIFAEVTVDPDAPISSSPFVIFEDLIFETNGNSQTVVLEAWGQNAIYINGMNAGGAALLSCDLGEEVWDDPKPYVIRGVLFIDSCTLVLPANTRIYVHGGIVRQYVEPDSMLNFYNDGIIFVLSEGKIKANGTLDEPVIIQGDRLEEAFQERSGQWAGIRFGAGSTGNEFNYTTVKNSIIGARVDSAAVLTLNSSKIYNTAGSGIIGIHSTINANNTLVYNNGGNCMQVVYGGDYNFNYCTLASYGVESSALFLSNALCLDLLCQEYRWNRLRSKFKNSIVFGSRDDEISLFDRQGTGTDPFIFDYDFQNCIVRVEELLDEENGYPTFFNNCDPCQNADGSDAVFLDPNEDDYHLDTLSIAEQRAVPITGLSIDLDGEMRDGGMPDVGCYEYLYE